jgi:hypothetical protein
MINIYPAPNANAGNPDASYNYVNEPVRSLNETKFDARLDETLTAADNLFARFSYDQAFSFVPGGAPGLAEANAFGSNENLINHARNIGLGWSHVFSPTVLNQATVGYDRIFDYIASQGNFTCESAILGIPNADLGCSSSGTPNSGGSYSEGLGFHSSPGRLLGPRRSRLLSLSGWNQHLLLQRRSGPDPRQA